MPAKIVTPGETNALRISAAINDHAALIDGGGSSAPSGADYLVRTAHVGLSAERVVTDTDTVTWDWGAAGQAKAIVNVMGAASSGAGAAKGLTPATAAGDQNKVLHGDATWRMAGWTLLQTQTVTSVAQMDFTTGLDDTYDTYKLIVSACRPASAANFGLRFGTGAGPTYQATNYAYRSVLVDHSGTSAAAAASGTEVRFTQAVGATAGTHQLDAEITFWNPEATNFPRVIASGYYVASAGTTHTRFDAVGAYTGAAAPITGIRLLFDGGVNIANCRGSLYGLAK